MPGAGALLGPRQATTALSWRYLLAGQIIRLNLLKPAGSMPSLIAPNYHVYLAVILTTQSPCYPPDVQQAVFTDEQGRSCPTDPWQGPDLEASFTTETHHWPFIYSTSCRIIAVL